MMFPAGPTMTLLVELGETLLMGLRGMLLSARNALVFNRTLIPVSSLAPDQWPHGQL